MEPAAGSDQTTVSAQPRGDGFGWNIQMEKTSTTVKATMNGQIPGRHDSRRSHKRSARRLVAVGRTVAKGASTLSSNRTLAVLSPAANREVNRKVSRAASSSAEDRIHRRALPFAAVSESPRSPGTLRSGSAFWWYLFYS